MHPRRVILRRRIYFRRRTYHSIRRVQVIHVTLLEIFRRRRTNALGLVRVPKTSPLRAADVRTIAIAPTSYAQACAFRFIVASKTRCASLNGLLGLLDCSAEGNKVVGVNDSKLFGIGAALEIERFVFGAVDVNDLTRFQANPNSCR